MQPRVTFVVPCYNYGRFLAQAIDTILDQTLKEIEIVAIDDASSDDTSLVLDRYATEPRVRTIRHAENQGNIRTYNEGLALARGEFVGIMSADDFAMRSDAVARQVAVFDAHPSVGLVYSDWSVVDRDGCLSWVRRIAPSDYVNKGHDEFLKMVYGIDIPPASGTLVRRSCHDTVGFYDPGFWHAGDRLLWSLLSAHYDVGYIADSLYAYRVHGSNMMYTRVTPGQATEQYVQLVMRAFAELPASAPAAVRAQLRPALRRAWLAAVAEECSSNRIRRAWSGLGYVTKRSPGLVLTPDYWWAVAKVIGHTLLGHHRYMDLAVLWREMRGDAPLQAAQAA